MSYILVIVESPSKCKKIEHYLNNNNEKKYKCMASYGHIRELDGLNSIDIHNNFAPTFKNSESKKEQIAKLKKAIKEANEVILASDDDREGEAIAWHLCQVFNLPIKTTKRILFHEITETALQKAIANPTTLNMRIVNAQLARQVLDVLVGYKVSPLLWHHVKDGLSAGRCQTPALRLIYENQKENDIATATGGKKSYTITGYFTSQNIPFVLNEEETDEQNIKKFLQASLEYSHIYKPFKLQTKNRAAPEPFTTSSLQQTCSNELHISPKETMSICQTLYEGGHITYHRTDSKKYSDEFWRQAREYITNVYGAESMLAESMLAESMQQPTTNDDKPITSAPHESAPHEAIRITKLECKSLGEESSAKESRVYQLIRQRTLESCMKDAIVSVLTATISAPFDKEYRYSTEQIVFAGWKKVASNTAENDKHYSFLQSLKPNAVIQYKKIKANLHLTELKTHLTEARLVHLLEERGIGRPSTFSSIIEKIQERKYVKKENIKGRLISCTDYEVDGKQIIKITLEKEFGNEKNKLVIQPVGIMALEFLLEHFETLFQYSYTKQMEDELDAVAKGEKEWHVVCQTCYLAIEKLMSVILKRGKETIRIDDNHIYMIGKYGPVIKVGSTAPQNPPSEENIYTKKKLEQSSLAGDWKSKASSLWLPVKKDIDLNKLRRGEYTLEDIVEDQLKPSIGVYKDEPVYIKAGKFGKYLEWKGQTQSLKHLKQPIDEITLEDVLELLYDLHSDNAGENAGDSTKDKSGVLRVITEDASIRKGKGEYKNYIFYKNKKMKKPRFLKLDGFTGDYLTCDLPLLQEWFKNKYKVDII
jgi:DNA topoisomerase-1